MVLRLEKFNMQKDRIVNRSTWIEELFDNVTGNSYDGVTCYLKAEQ